MTNLDLEKYFNKKKDIFKDASVFDNYYYPERPIERKEAITILEKVADFMRLGVVENLLIVGKHGSGKTLYGKYLLKQIDKVAKRRRKEVYVEYRNCTDFNHSLLILKSLCSLKETGIVNDKIVENAFFKELDKDMILILDEIDELDNADYLLYILSRLAEIQSITHKKVQLILISNNFGWNNDLEPAARSSLNITKIIFEGYSKNQIKDILKQRLRFGLIKENIISEKILNFVVDKTINNNSDLRIALKSLFLICKEIEKLGLSKITNNFLEDIHKEALRQVQLERIAKLDDNHLLILYSVAIARDNAIRRIFEREYRVAGRDSSSRILGYTRFTFYLNSLKDQDMILISKEKRERFLFNRAKLLINKLVVIEEYEKRKILLAKH